MRIRQFTAATTADALRALRDELGEEALVLSTHSEPGCVVITAAVGVDDGAASTAALDDRPGARVPAQNEPQGDDVRFDLALIRTQLEQLGRKVHRMDRVLLDLDGAGGTLGPDGREVAEQLLSSGLGRHLAQPVAQRFEREVALAGSRADALRASLLEHVAVAAPSSARVVALVGPTGSGKTTTIAKLAARAVQAGGAPPGLVIADNERVGAAEQLASYARLFGSPLYVARDAVELESALVELAGCERILIDTGGLCGDPASCAELQSLLAGAGSGLDVTAVVSATSSLSSLQRGWPQLARLGPSSCVVTRLDECDEPGIACTWLAEAGLPLAWLGTGRRVPDDLVAASGDDLVRWLIAA